jgi:hypothetical protein
LGFLSDAEDIGAVIDEMYAMISGPKGPRDWSRQRGVFHPDARQMRTGLGADGAPWIRIMSPDQYAADTTPFFAANDFDEIEIAREIRIFGNMAQVWSAYRANDRRGINAIQLYRGEDRRWLIISMIWDNERPGLELPDF